MDGGQHGKSRRAGVGLAELKNPGNDNLGNKLIKGSVWMLAMRWLSRFMGLASMVVVARLLVPADFGIYAVATAFIALLDAFTDIGTDIAVIRHKDPQQRHYDTAWTFKIILHCAAALLIVLGAPLAASLYADPRYEAVLQVLALSMLVSGFTNIGIANFRRDLQFHKDFQYNVLVQLAGVLTTLVLAFLFRSYWALVLGSLARSLVAAILSYLMQDYRPRLSIDARKEMFGFSFWVMVRSVALFLVGGADRLILGAFFSPAIIGMYAIASTLATMAVFELLFPIGRALLPGLAAKQGDTEWERRNLKKIFNGTATIAAAAGLGLSALATSAVTLIYGEQFAGAGPMLTILAISAAVGGFNQPVGQYLMVLGRTRELAFLFLLEGVAAIFLTYLMAKNDIGIQAILYGRLVVALLALARVAYLLRSVKVIQWSEVGKAWIRPFLAGLVMYMVLWWFQSAITLPDVLIVAIGIPVGVMVYVFTVFVLWHFMKRPEGIEGEALKCLMSRYRKN